MSNVAGKVQSVNVGKPRQVEWHGRIVETGIWKKPVEGSVRIEGVNLEGDGQADLRVHGGPDKAVYAYSAEDYEWWSGELGRDLAPGTFGENLTVSGLDLAGALIGERWSVGSAVLEVSQPRLPCSKLGIRMKDPDFRDRFDDAGRFGTYLRIIEEGSVAAGNAVEVLSRPDHDLTITELGRASPHQTPETVNKILSTPGVPASWTDWAERTRERSSSR